MAGVQEPQPSLSSAAPASADYASHYQAFEQFGVLELLSALTGRLVAFSVIFGASVFGASVVYDGRAHWFGILWLWFAMLQLVAYGALMAQKSMPRCFNCAMISVACLLGWWALLPIFQQGHPFFWVVSFGFMVMMVGMLPWPPRQVLTLGSLFLIVALALADRTGHRWIVSGLSILIVLVSVRIAAENHLSWMSRLTLAYMNRYCESPSGSSEIMLRLFADFALLLGDGKHSLLTSSAGRFELLTKGEMRGTEQEGDAPRGLMQKALDRGQEQSLLAVKDLDESYHPGLLRLFGKIPRSLLYFRFLTILGSKEEKVFVFIPLWRTADLLWGSERLFRQAAALAAVVRVASAAARSRFHSSDALLHSERSVSDREDELNHLVHLANNIAQDMNVRCEELRSQLESGEAQAQSAVLSPLVDAIEADAVGLAAGVSDVKLLGELRRLGSLARLHVTPLDSVLDALRRYALFRRASVGQAVRLDCAQTGLAVQAAGPEFLEAALRALIQEAGKSAKEIVLKIRSTTMQVLFEMELPHALEEAEISASSAARMQAVANLARLSNGEFNVARGDRTKLLLALPRAEAPNAQPEPRPVALRWALLLDDNPQVTTFYARVTEALGLGNKSAGSVQEAREILARGDRPDLIISDIQLGDGSGVELVSYARELLGRELPIVVVSGNTTDEVRHELSQVGVTKVLSKPLSRSKLFSELQEIISRVG